jgi:hypothetical protein
LNMMVAFDPWQRLFAFLTVLALTTMMATISACGSATGGQGEGQKEGSRPNNQQQESGQEEPAGGDQQNPEPAPPDDSSKGTGGGAAGGKVYRVGDAGEVELRVEDARYWWKLGRTQAGTRTSRARETR